MFLPRKLNERYLALSFWTRLIIATFAVSLLIISTQNLQIFPGAVSSIFDSKIRNSNELPENVESIFVTTADNEKLELWRLEQPSSKQVAVIFHGNGADVANFFPYQQYFASIGITSYGFDYRGYGKSSGWPSERGLYLDGQAVIHYILEREKISLKEIVIVGISIGSGAAAHMAAEFNPGALILFSPFASLAEAVRNVPLFGLLSKFTMYDFSVKEDVQRLNTSCLILAHGEKDNVIPIEQGKDVFDAYRGTSFSKFLISPTASHNDILFKIYPEVTTSIKTCFSAILR